MMIPLWLIITFGVIIYVIGFLITKNFALMIDDGPTFILWLDNLISALAIFLWPITWVLVILLVIVGKIISALFW